MLQRSVTIYDRNGQSVTQVNLPDSDFEVGWPAGALPRGPARRPRLPLTCLNLWVYLTCPLGAV